MRLIFVMLLAGLSVAAGPISVNSSADDVLDALDARGKNLQTLTADVKTSNSDLSAGDSDADVRAGRLYLQMLPDGDSRWHAVFDKKLVDNRIYPVKHEWSYSDRVLTDRDYRTKQQSTTQIVKPGEKMQLFDLEGPFPLPLGQDKADVRKHFDVKEVPLDKGDPTGTVHLQLTPVPNTSLARKFKTIDLWVDPKIDMPIRITLLDRDGSNLRQNDISNVKINEPAQDKDFKMEKVEAGWDFKDDGSPQ